MEYVILGVVVALSAVIAQTGAMFYWGGKISAGMETLNFTARDHEKRIRSLENPREYELTR